MDISQSDAPIFVIADLYRTFCRIHQEFYGDVEMQSSAATTRQRSKYAAVITHKKDAQYRS